MGHENYIILFNRIVESINFEYFNSERTNNKWKVREHNGNMVTYLRFEHGQAEDDAGFDITFIIPKDGNEKVKLGKTKVGIITLQGLKEGIMYTWVDPMFNKHTKGLIVYPEDTKAKAYAEKTFANPPLNI